MGTRSFRLAYGLTTIEATLDRGTAPQALFPCLSQPAESPHDLIRKSIRNPVDSPPLSDLVRPKDKIAVIISDSTRSSASHLVLPILVDELTSAGADTARMDIVVALGVHRRQTQAEHRALVGEAVFGTIRISDHDAYDPAALVPIGRTSRATLVSISKTVAQADKVIILGAVIPHYFAGFGGRRKSVMPGISSEEANLRSHFLVFNPAGGRNPLAKTARLAGNPVHEDMLEAAELVAPHFTLNTVLDPEKRLCAVFAGGLIEAHRQACAYYLEHFSLSVDTAADLTIVSCGGYPKDINFIQAHKAIQSAYAVTRPGGWMIILAECSDGYGYPNFIDWFRYNSMERFEQTLRQNYHIYGQTAYAMYEKATSVNIALVSNLAPREVERMRAHPFQSFEKAYAAATDDLGGGFTTYVLPASPASIFYTQAERAEVSASVAQYRNCNGRTIS